jgi:hypothetical protein
MSCECPTVSVSGPSSPAKFGDSVTFRAYVSGGSQNDVTHNWTVSSGTIVSGQGISQFSVKADKDKKSDVITATVEIGGLCPGCPNSASASVKLRDK